MPLLVQFAGCECTSGDQLIFRAIVMKGGFTPAIETDQSTTCAALTHALERLLLTRDCCAKLHKPHVQGDAKKKSLNHSSPSVKTLLSNLHQPIYSAATIGFLVGDSTTRCVDGQQIQFEALLIC